MKKSRFTESQMMAILEKGGSGSPVSPSTFWAENELPDGRLATANLRTVCIIEFFKKDYSLYPYSSPAKISTHYNSTM